MTSKTAANPKLGEIIARAQKSKAEADALHVQRQKKLAEAQQLKQSYLTLSMLDLDLPKEHQKCFAVTRKSVLSLLLGGTEAERLTIVQAERKRFASKTFRERLQLVDAAVKLNQDLSDDVSKNYHSQPVMTKSELSMLANRSPAAFRQEMIRVTAFKSVQGALLAEAAALQELRTRLIPRVAAELRSLAAPSTVPDQRVATTATISSRQKSEPTSN